MLTTAPIFKTLEHKRTLGHGLLAVTATDTDTVDHVALLGLVPETAGLVRTRWAGRAVDNVQLPVLPAPTRRCEQKCAIRRPIERTERGEESEEHQIVSSCRAPRCICMRPSCRLEGEEDQSQLSSCQCHPTVLLRIRRFSSDLKPWDVHDHIHDDERII